jgi:hypothetical protein
MSRGLLALLFLLAALPDALAGDAVSAIDACIRELDPALDVGYQRIAARCPDLAPSLAASSAAASLPAGWNQSGNQLSADGLAELRTLLTRGLTSAVPLHPLRLERVGPLLAQLARDGPAHGGWWTRFKSWLRGLFTPRPEPQADRGWLRWLFGEEGLSQGVLQGIVWAALAVVIALAGAIIVNELRVAGVLRPLRLRPASGSRVGAVTMANATSQDVERAAPLQQPRLLLELIAARLAEQERLPPARALTVQELARAARLPDAADRARLQALGAACERVRFSDREIPPQALAGALAQGRELLAALLASAPQSQRA